MEDGSMSAAVSGGPEGVDILGLDGNSFSVGIAPVSKAIQ